MLLTKRQQKIVIYIEKLAQNLWAYCWDVLTFWSASLETHGQSRMRLLTVGQLFDHFSFLWIFKYSQSSDKVAKFIWIRQRLFMRTRKNQRVNPRSVSIFKDWRWVSRDVIISTIYIIIQNFKLFFFSSPICFTWRHFRQKCVLNHRTNQNPPPPIFFYSVIQFPCMWNILYKMDKRS